MDGKSTIDVIILAGGLGTRLRSVVADRPKCMAPVAGKPFLFYLLTTLSRYPIGKVVLSVGYLHEVIMDWMDGLEYLFPFELEYAVEETPLGTGGGIRLSLQHCDAETVCVMNGDTFLDIDLEEFREEHLRSGRPVSLALKHLTDFERYGTVTLDESDVVSQFNEKRYCAEGWINAGVYMLNNEGLLDLMPEKFSFEKDFLEPQAALDALQGYRCDGYFIDIGVPEDYEKAQHDFLDFESLGKTND